nr:hypothetical protein [Tanacetum cinerariifolium]
VEMAWCGGGVVVVVRWLGESGAWHGGDGMASVAWMMMTRVDGNGAVVLLGGVGGGGSGRRRGSGEQPGIVGGRTGDQGSRGGGRGTKVDDCESIDLLDVLLVVKFDEQSVFNHWDWTSNGAWCNKGTRIINGWNHNDVDVVVIDQDDQVIHTRIWLKKERKEVFCSFIYAHNRYTHRRSLWRSLSKHTCSLPTELKDFPSKFNELTEEIKSLTSQVAELKTLKWELLEEFLSLPAKVELAQAKIKTLDALPSLLLNVTKSLNKFAEVLESTSTKAGDQSVLSVG